MAAIELVIVGFVLAGMGAVGVMATAYGAIRAERTAEKGADGTVRFARTGDAVYQRSSD